MRKEKEGVEKIGRGRENIREGETSGGDEGKNEVGSRRLTWTGNIKNRGKEKDFEEYSKKRMGEG